MPFVSSDDRKSHEARRPRLKEYPQSSDYDEITPYITGIAQTLADNAKEYYVCGHSPKARDTVNVGGIGEHEFHRRLKASIRSIVGKNQRFKLTVEMDDYGNKTIAELTLTIH